MIQKIHLMGLVCRKCDGDSWGEIHLLPSRQDANVVTGYCGRGLCTKLNGMSGLTLWPFLVSMARRKGLTVSRCLVR